MFNGTFSVFQNIYLLVPSSLPIIQLGLSQPLSSSPSTPDLAHTSPNWFQWDGGKIGGVPSWLGPRDTLEKSPFTCPARNILLGFIAQLYRSVGDNDRDDSFHRTVYVFCRLSLARCSYEGEGGCLDTEFCVSHCQLPRGNDCYPYRGDEICDDYENNNARPCG